MRKWLRRGILLLIALLAGLFICQGLHAQELPPDRPQSSVEMGMVLQEKEGGLYVLAVSEQGAAGHAGIRPGDVLLRVDDTALDSMQQLDDMMGRSDPPRQMTLLRGEREVTVLLP